MKKILFALMMLALCLAGCHNDNGTGSNALPTITGMSPAQVGNGSQHVNGTISGANLSGATAVNLGADVTVETFSSVSDSQVSVTFSVSGNASAGARTITVTCAKGTATSASVFSITIVNKPPVASFSISPANGDTSTTFHLDGSASHDPDGKVSEWDWSFGDGKKGNGKTIDHKFVNAGTFTITLKVKDNKGLESDLQKDLKVDKVTTIECTHKLAYRRIGVFGKVLAVDGPNITWKTDTPHTCDTAYYWCGDFNNPSETEFYGFVCSMSYLGDSTFVVGVKHGKLLPPVGQEAFIKASNCVHKNPCL